MKKLINYLKSLFLSGITINVIVIKGDNNTIIKDSDKESS